MPNSNQHFILGLLAGGLNYLGRKRLKCEQADPSELVAHALLGGASSLLPDMFEPADNPRHRKFGHSFSLGFGLISILNSIEKSTTISSKEKDFWRTLILGYESHLIADATTPASLPII